MFDNLTNKFQNIATSLKGKGKLNEKNIKDALSEVRIALIDADVSIEVLDVFVENITARALGGNIHESLTPDQQFIKIVDEELKKILGESVELDLSTSPREPQVMLMVGLQGSGKTTHTAKIAHHLKQKGHRILLVGADLARPSALEQLKVLAKQVGVDVYSEKASKPSKLVKGAMKHAKAMGATVVIFDTAGRTNVDEKLMSELQDLDKLAKPDVTLLVVDAMLGQACVEIARAFSQKIKLTGAVLTKLDGDARGGAALSVRHATGVPIIFSGVGETIEDLEQFYPDRMAERILGMGDMLSLIEKAEKTFDEDEAEVAAQRMQEGKFDLNDFLKQLKNLKRMGPLQNLIGMLPGLPSELRNADVPEDALTGIEAIISSMTMAEREDPKILNGSRRQRIAIGSGTTVQEVNKIMNQFAQMQKMITSMMGGGQTQNKKGKNKVKKPSKMKAISQLRDLKNMDASSMPDLKDLFK